MAMSAFERKMKEYEVLLEALKTSLIVSEQGLRWYKEHADVSVDGKMISSELLRRLLTEEDYYEYVEMLFSDKIDKYTVNCIVDLEESKLPITLSKVAIVKGIRKCVSEKLFTLDEVGEERLNELAEKIDFKLFANEIEEKTFILDIDGEDFEVDITNILKFLNFSDKEYEEFFDLEKENNIFGIPKDKFVYIVVKFVDDYDIFYNYLVPDEIKRRCDELESNEKIDIQSINEIVKTYAPNLEKVKIDSRLREEILDGLPSDVSDLEKCAYVYIKMCKLLTYDDEFYAFDLEGSVREKHEDISNLRNIKLGNNRVVCYEFNALYAKILNELGIRFEMNVNPFRQFGGGHANLEFRDGKFLVMADSVVSILNGDLTRAKLNQELNGFICQNTNEKTKEEFREKVTKMYELVVKQEHEKNDDKSKIVVGKTENFDDIMSKYKKLSIVKKVDLEEKFQIMIDKAEKSGLYKVDVFAYFLQLKKIIFSEYEQQKNIKISIIKKNIGLDSATVNAIFSLNKTRFYNNEEENIYYIHDGYNLRLSSKEELEGWFGLGLFAYISEDDSRIPGIRDKGYRGRR